VKPEAMVSVAQPVRLIFLNRFFHPDHSATSQMLSDLAFALAGPGCKVTVITSRLRYDDANARLPPREVVDGVDIVRVATSRFGRHVLAGRAVDYATFYLNAAWALLRTARKGDVVVAKTDPPMLGIIMRFVARLKGARFVNWLQDIFPEVALALGIDSRPARALFAVLRRFRDNSLRKADLNVAIGELMAGRLAALGVAPECVRVIPNWIDTGLVRPVEPADNSLRAEWGLDQDFVVGYSGNLGRAHDVETLLAAIASTEHNTQGGDVRWLFIGGGAQYDALRAAAAMRGLGSVLFRPYQPRERLAESLSVADLHIVSLRPELEGLIVPSKFYGIAAAGRATVFIGEKDGEIARLVALHDCGITVPQGDGAGLAARVAELAQDRTRCMVMGTNARRAAEAQFDLTKAIEAWEAAVAALPEPRPSQVPEPHSARKAS